jgi:PAS domain S-box-containing protein
MAAGSSRTMWQGIALIGLPALIAVGLEAYNATSVAPELAQNQGLVAHTLEVIAAARSFDLAIGDAESAERGFIITADNAYLATYRKNTALVSERLARLKRLIADNPDQQRRLVLIESATEGRLAEMQAGILARQNVGFIEARRVVQSHLGADTRGVISGLVDLAIKHENGLLAQRQATLAAFQATNEKVDLLSIGLVFALLVLGVYLLAQAVLRESRSVAQLRQSEERFRLLVSGVRDYAIFLLDADGKVESWNLGAERIKGYRQAEILGKDYSIFYLPEERESGTPASELSQAAEQGAVETEGWRVRKDGSRFYAHAILTALRAEDESLRGFAKITRDVTERRAQQKALEDSRAALAQAQKMESLGQLTGGMAHDFNNLLTVIIGSIDLVQRKRVSEDKVDELLDAAKLAGEQGASLVRRLLAFSRRQTLAPQNVDVNRLVTGMSELLRRTLGESVVLETVLGGGVWRTLVDPNQLESALLNLAVNARDAMGEHGKLTIETGNTFLDEAYAATQGELAPGEYVVIAVSDSGTGMSPQTIARAFDPFFTTKPEGRGTGLGLSQVHGFVKQSGGHVALYSEPGQGTTVKMYLPRNTAVDLSDRQDPPKPEEMAPSGETVLLVEDEPLVRMYGSEALGELGYVVLEASDGHEALRTLDAHPEITLLFTDVGLPGGMNGRRLAEEARARMPSLKVLFATGYAKDAVVHNGVLATGVELLEKPYTIESLAKKLKQMAATGKTLS